MGDTPHILHVDDSEDDRMLFSRALAKSGLAAELRSVGSASEALLVLNRLGPHVQAPTPRLIVLDLSLPRLDGRELLAILRSNANSRFRNIPVVVLTASDSATDHARGRAFAVEDYVVKSKSFDEFVAMVAALGRWLAKPAIRPTDARR